MTLNKLFELHKDGCAQSCISVHQLPYNNEKHKYEETYFEEEDQEEITQSNTYKQIKNMQVDHFNVIGGGMYPVELCIYLSQDREK